MYRRIEVVINTSELGAGTRGASLGPQAIMAAARKREHTFFADYPPVVLPDFNSSLDHPVTTPFARHIEGYEKAFEALSTATSTAIKAGKFPLVLSGDHSSGAATIAGVKMADPNKRVGVVWIDAHADIHSPFTTPSGNLHGMPVALALGLDNLSLKKNDLDEVSLAVWKKLQDFGNGGPKLKIEDLVYIAVRDTEEEEDSIIAEHQIALHSVAEVRTNGVAAIIDSVNQQLADCDAIYVSFDVDSMDPELTSFGTGTPVGNGITPEEARELLTAFAASPKTACIEIVEVNPCLDNKGNVMAETAFNLLTAVADTLNS